MILRCASLIRVVSIWFGCAVFGCSAAVTGSASRTDAAPTTTSAAFVVGSLDDESDLGERDAPAPSVPEFTSILLQPERPRSMSWSGPGADTAYALDGVSRLLRSNVTQPACPSSGLLSYGGSRISFGGAAIVNASFRDRLERFEEVVNDVALMAYGRAPVRIRHRGAFACRSRRGQPLLLSEHALGNAIDVSGFDFAPALVGTDPVQDTVPSTAFSVTVARNWDATDDPIDARHARFLHSLIARLVARGDVFRGIITPKDAAHSDHFHFDMARRGYVRL